MTRPAYEQVSHARRIVSVDVWIGEVEQEFDHSMDWHEIATVKPPAALKLD